MSFTLADSHTNTRNRNSHHDGLETQLQSSERNKSADTGDLKRKMSAGWDRGLRREREEREDGQWTYR